jgi:uncharacterized damage-inducible protein DinB
MKTTSGSATTEAAEFIEASRVFLTKDFLPRLIECLERMPDEDIWWRPNEQSNSAGNLVLHLCGNVRQWVSAAIGGVKFQRNRAEEFSTRNPIPKAELIGRLRAAVGEVDEVLSCLPANRLLVHYMIQSYKPTGLQAIYHVVEHFSYHLGQILYIYKLRTGIDPGFYRDLSKQ